MRKISIILLVILIATCNVSASGLQYFEETEEGYLLPYEHEDKLVEFINGLNNKVIDLQDAIKEERQAHSNVIQVKNNKINNLEDQIKIYKDIVNLLEDIISNKDTTINIQDKQLELLDSIIKDYEENESINQSIVNNYENKLQAKDRLLDIEKEKNTKKLIKFTSYSFIAGIIIGLISK